MTATNNPFGIDLDHLGKRLRERGAGDLWRSLEELASDPAAEEWLTREMPADAELWPEGVSRRRFLQLMGASLAFGGLAACTPSNEKIVPYIENPERMTPGRPLLFATAIPFRGYARGVLARSDMGRPTKLEGNPQHPASLGATDIFVESEILTLYDPDRSRSIRHSSQAAGAPFRTASREQLSAALDGRFTRAARNPAGLRLLTPAITSPTLQRQIAQIVERFPGSVWHRYEPLSREASRQAARLAFGQPLDPIHHFDRAAIVVALDADFLHGDPASIASTAGFVSGRSNVSPASPRMNRLYAAEPSPTLTGANADRRLPVRAGRVAAIAAGIAQALGVAVPSRITLTAAEQQFVDEAAGDLRDTGGRSIVLAGEQQPAGVHLIVHAINDALGNHGTTISFIPPFDGNPSDRSLLELTTAAAAGTVETLVIIGGNPLYAAPADVDFGAALRQIPFSLHHSLYFDETSRNCNWHLPAAHPLEEWSDLRAFDGTVSIVQPLIEPLHGGMSAHLLLALLAGEGLRSGDQIVRETWGSPEADDPEWRSVLHDGVMPDSASTPVTISYAGLQTIHSVADLPQEGLELNFRPDPTILDGRFANNAWLQELPKPLTKLTWDNAAMLSPRTAAAHRLSNGDLVTLTIEGREIDAPVWITPGHADGAVTVHLGYGRSAAGSVGNDTGFNAYALRTIQRPHIANGLAIHPTGGRQILAATQQHHSMEGRDIIRSATLADFTADGRVGPPPLELPSLYPDFVYDDYSWGMTIDLNRCTGCNACVIACQAENNIPVVGKDQVHRGREMHWLRIDRYYEGDPDNPRTYHQPVLCMHCDKAPCEYVCPTTATVHSTDGLNEMIYSRCVGTRFCGNNCPYKVRRFNFLQYATHESPTISLMRNPRVTVRSKGVMEKCTFCVHRIRTARTDAERERRRLEDGEVLTACQSACPARAIVFGNLNDERSELRRELRSERSYKLLEELNTRPRVTYLARILNPPVHSS
jgi:MoCo/4Fe-4S cofactor protein with predicted Tat translocation signal